MTSNPVLIDFSAVTTAYQEMVGQLALFSLSTQKSTRVDKSQKEVNIQSTELAVNKMKMVLDSLKKQINGS